MVVLAQLALVDAGVETCDGVCEAGTDSVDCMSDRPGSLLGDAMGGRRSSRDWLSAGFQSEKVTRESQGMKPGADVTGFADGPRRVKSRRPSDQTSSGLQVNCVGRGSRRPRESSPVLGWIPPSSTVWVVVLPFGICPAG